MLVKSPSHRKGPSQYKRSDVETCIDPFSLNSMAVQPNQSARTSCQKTDSLTTHATVTPRCVDSQPTLPVCMTASSYSTSTQQHCNTNTGLGSCVFTVPQSTSTNIVATSQSIVTSRQMDSHLGTQNNTIINNVIATALAQLFQCNRQALPIKLASFP